MSVLAALIFVALACGIGCVAGGPARRCAFALAALHLAANIAGWNTQQWFGLFVLNLTAMYFTFWRPAGWFQQIMAGLFLAGAVEHLAFAFSSQSYNAEMVAWQFGMWTALAEAAALFIYSGGRLVGIGRRWNALRRRKMVRFAQSAVAG